MHTVAHTTAIRTALSLILGVGMVLVLGIQLDGPTGKVKPGIIAFSNADPGDVSALTATENGRKHRGSVNRDGSQGVGQANDAISQSSSEQTATEAYDTIQPIAKAEGQYAASTASFANMDNRATGSDDSSEASNLHSGKSAGEPREIDDASQLNGRFVISGRVLNEGGYPLAGIELIAQATRLFDLPASTSIPAGELRRGTISESTGAYAFRELASGDYVVSTVPTAQYLTSQISVRAGIDFADLVLVGRKEMEIFGFVRTNDGQPLEAVQVTPTVLGERAVYTDSNGRYVLRLKFKDNSRGFAIRAQHIDFREQMIVLRDKDLGQRQLALDFTMEPIAALTTVTGGMVGIDGAPVVNKVVRLHSQLLRQTYHASTNEDGRFVLQGVETGADYQLRVAGGDDYQDYVRQNVRITAAGLNLAVLLEPAMTSTVFGQMLSMDGTPIPYFSLILRKKEAPYHAVQVTGDGAGSYVAPNVPAGEIIFETRSHPKFSITGIESHPGGEQQVPLVLDWGSGELRGFVTDSLGNPVHVPNIHLTWSHTDNNGLRSWSSRTTAADAQGYFSFSQLGPGLHSVIINAPGFEQARIDHDVTTQGYDLVVQLNE